MSVDKEKSSDVTDHLYAGVRGYTRDPVGPFGPKSKWLKNRSRLRRREDEQ